MLQTPEIKGKLISDKSGNNTMRKPCDPSKRSQLLIIRHDVPSKKIWIFNNTAVTNSKCRNEIVP